jgi:hypothetical protein
MHDTLLSYTGRCTTDCANGMDDSRGTKAKRGASTGEGLAKATGFVVELAPPLA